MFAGGDEKVLDRNSVLANKMGALRVSLLDVSKEFYKFEVWQMGSVIAKERGRRWQS